MTTHRPRHPRRRSRGVSVLYVTLVLVLLSSIAVYRASSSAVNEQRISGNEIRAQQAHSAAQAGLDLAMAYFSADSETKDFEENGTDGKDKLQTLSNKSKFRVRFCTPSTDPAKACPASSSTPLRDSTGAAADWVCAPPAKDEYRRPLVIACGWSDDERAVVGLVQQISGSPASPGGVSAPSVTSGANNLLTGGGSILNYYNDLTVWSGGPVPSQSATGKTFIRDIVTDPSPSQSVAATDPAKVGNSPTCNNPPEHYRCSTSGTELGPDVITDDTALSTLSPSAFFSAFMGLAPTEYLNTKARWRVDLNGQLAAAGVSSDSTSISSVTGKQNTVIWVEGNVNSIGNVGTPTAPVTLVINGDWNVNASPTIHGLVFVTGTVTGNGSPTVVGAMISKQLNLNGNGRVIYDPTALENAKRTGTAAVVPGSWRDWTKVAP